VVAPHSVAPPLPPGTTDDSLGAPTVLPGQPGPLPRLVGSLPQLASEILALLHQRLRLLSLIFVVGWVLIWSHKFFRLQMTPDTVWLIVVPGGVLLALEMAIAATLWAPRRRSLRRLRGYELLGLALPTAVWLWENYFTIYRPGDMGGWVHRYVQRDLSEMITLARHTSIVWCILIVGYGIFVPNTLRRCAAMTGSLACIVLAMKLVCGLWDETIPRPYLFSYLAEMVTWLVIAVGFSIYGSHKISLLRQQAFEARRLGQYQVKHRLGAGGMGAVYLAEHVLLRRPCALKLIRPERAGDPRNLARFEREVQAIATLTHPNTVEIFDYGHADDGTFYYAMEYLSGLSLQELVRRYGPLPPERAVHLLRQVCGALQEAHTTTLVHRDVKPGNVLVCQQGGQHDVAKLLEFGLVRAHGLTADGEKLTQEGAIAGPPAYISPEQAAGKEDVDGRSDLYSLGAVAYFLLTGRPPFVRDGAVQTLAAHLGEPVVAPDRHRPDVPADLQAVVLRCLEKGPGPPVRGRRRVSPGPGPVPLRGPVDPGASRRLVARLRRRQSASGRRGRGALSPSACPWSGCTAVRERSGGGRLFRPLAGQPGRPSAPRRSVPRPRPSASAKSWCDRPPQRSFTSRAASGSWRSSRAAPRHGPQTGFVGQGRSFQRLPGPFVRHLRGRQVVQLVGNQRQELHRGVRVAVLDIAQDSRDVGHNSPVYRW
jgi:serine/threonine-protein kinase